MALSKRRVHLEFVGKNTVKITTIYHSKTFDINNPCILDLTTFKMYNLEYREDSSGKNLFSPLFIAFHNLELSNETIVLATLFVQSSEDKVDKVTPACYYKNKEQTWSASVWIQ